MAIEAKVATVFNRRDVAINAGADKGVLVDDVARLVRRTDVNDPDTGEFLGRSESTIIRLQVTTVAPRFSIARTFEYSSSPRRVRQVTENALESTTFPHLTLVTPGMDVVIETPEPASDEIDIDDLPF